MRTRQTVAEPKKQTYAANLEPGDVVAMASGTKQVIGVFRGHGIAGNKQVVLPQWGEVTKGIPSLHIKRLVKVNFTDLDLETQNKIAPIIEKYKQR